MIFKKIIKIIPPLLMLVVVFGLLTIFQAPVVNAQAIGGGGANGTDVPFGGRISDAYFCNCSYNFMLTISNPVGGVFMYDPAETIVYMFYQIYYAGPWVLGNRTQANTTQCLVYVGSSCATVGTFPLITMVGTSGPD